MIEFLEERLPEDIVEEVLDVSTRMQGFERASHWLGSLSSTLEEAETETFIQPTDFAKIDGTEVVLNAGIHRDDPNGHLGGYTKYVVSISNMPEASTLFFPAWHQADSAIRNSRSSDFIFRGANGRLEKRQPFPATAEYMQAENSQVARFSSVEDYHAIPPLDTESLRYLVVSRPLLHLSMLSN